MDLKEQCDLAIEMWEHIKQEIAADPDICVGTLRTAFMIDKPVRWLHDCIFCNIFYDVMEKKCSLECPLAKYVGRIDSTYPTLCAEINTPYEIVSDTRAYLPHRLEACDLIIAEIRDYKISLEEIE